MLLSTQRAQSPQRPKPGPKSRKQKAPKRNEPPSATEINILRQTTNLLIPLAPFHRLVREIMHERDSTIRITRECLQALQESAELYLIQLLEDAYRCASHRDRITLLPKDLELVRYLRGTNDVGNKLQS